MKLHSFFRLSLLAATIALLPAWPAMAHEGHHHNAMGTIQAVQAEQLDLKTKDGKIQSFQLNAKTTYKRGDAAAKREDLKVGERAVVMYESKDGKNVAIEVKLATAGNEGHEGHAAIPSEHELPAHAGSARARLATGVTQGRH